MPRQAEQPQSSSAGYVWRKQGRIFSADGRYAWMKSHAQLPLVDQVTADVMRVYFGTRDEHNRTVTTYCEVDALDPRRVLYVHDRPVLGLGERGGFDDSGAMPAWMVSHRGVKYLFYTGWNVATTVPYRKAIGVAVSEDGGRTFSRVSNGPVLDRTYEEPYCAATPCVLLEGGLWRMWYLSCVRWEIHGRSLDPYYHIKYADSADGLHWNRPGMAVLDLRGAGEGALGRPCVRRGAEGGYTMWYSYRGEADFRTDRRYSYRIGYAESADGLTWNRLDERAGIDVSSDGWDSDMIAYPFVMSAQAGLQYLFYNGNGFGKSGFGYAVQADQQSEETVGAR